MKKERDIFLTALMFFSRIPVPRGMRHDPALMQEAGKYFPWIGWIVGGAAAGVFLLCLQVFSVPVSLLLSMICSVLITGALHEDGFADVCDGFGGGWTKEKILLIMKDSRLGTFGVIGVVFLLALKFVLLFELSSLLSIKEFLVMMIAGHAISRFAAITLPMQYAYVSDHTHAKSTHVVSAAMRAPAVFIALVAGIAPLLLLPAICWLTLVPVLLVRILLGRYFYKWIGGYTGDCLGALQQVAEISFYMGLLIICKFIL